MRIEEKKNQFQGRAMRIEVVCVCVCVWRGKGWEGGKDSKARMEAGAVRVRKSSSMSLFSRWEVVNSVFYFINLFFCFVVFFFFFYHVI